MEVDTIILTVYKILNLALLAQKLKKSTGRAWGIFLL